MSSLFNKLPNDLINVILSYNKHFKIRKGEPVTIIPRDDERYVLLSTIPLANTCPNAEDNILPEHVEYIVKLYE